MRLYEFENNNTINMEKRSCIGLEEALIKRSRKIKNFIYEDSQDVKDYKETILEEKSHTISYINLKPNGFYFPISLRGAPFQQTIYIDMPGNNIEYLELDGVDLIFQNSNNISKFRISKNNAVGTLETLIYSTKIEADHFITLLKIKFSSWYIPVTVKQEVK